MMEPGILLVLLSAFLSTLRESVRKHVSMDFSSVAIGLVSQVYGVILLLPFAYWRFTQTGLNLSPAVLGAVAVSGVVVVASTYLYIEAMRMSDLSLTEPLRKTTPIFVAVLEPLILGIDFRLTILTGALVGTAGVYVMVSEDSLLEPVKNMKNKGALLSLLVAFIFAVWAIAQRFGATNIDPLIFSYLTYVAGLAGFLVWHFFRDEQLGIQPYFRKDIFSLGVVTALSAVVSVFAYSMVSASEVTVIKQTSAIFGVLLGSRYFSEEDIARKLVGAAIIIAGAVLVVI